MLTNDIREFHERFGLRPLADSEGFLPDEACEFRIKFMLEELQEYCEAVGYALVQRDGALVPVKLTELSKTAPPRNAVAAFDALVDLAYVVLGTAYLHNFPFAIGWSRVHAANMQKVRASSADQSRRGSTLDVVKPPGWTPADLSDIATKTAREIALSCDCYPGCWGDHSEDWPQVDDPDGALYAKARATLSRGEYVKVGGTLRVIDKFRMARVTK